MVRYSAYLPIDSVTSDYFPMADPTTTYSHVLLVPYFPFAEYLDESTPTFVPNPNFQGQPQLSGHTRPVCVLAGRLLLEKENTVVTFLATPQQIEQVRKDISNQFPESVVSSEVKENALKRIRLVRIVLPDYCS